MHHFLKKDGINILSKHVQEEPITHFGFFDNDVDTFFLDKPITDINQIGPYSWRDNDEKSKNDNKKCQCQQQEHPEP